MRLPRHPRHPWERTWRSWRRALEGPGRERDLLTQAMKAAGAALLAWLIAGEWLNAPLSFLAPWVALVMVHATVYRSVVKGLQQVLMVVVGLLAAAGGHLVTGDRTLALAVVLVVTAPLMYWGRVGDQGIYAPLTAVFVLTTTGAPGPAELLSRLAETGLGVVVGVVVNALVFPPVHLRSAWASIRTVADELAELLEGIADGLRGDWGPEDARSWLGRSERIGRLVDDAWSAVEWGQESMRFNPRRPRWRDCHPVLLPLEIVTKQTRGICRTLIDAAQDELPGPDRRFVAFYADVLDHAAAVVRAFESERLDPDSPAPLLGAIEEARRRQAELHERLRAEEFDVDGWLIYGALLIEVDRLLAGLGQASHA